MSSTKTYKRYSLGHKENSAFLMRPPHYTDYLLSWENQTILIRKNQELPRIRLQETPSITRAPAADTAYTLLIGEKTYEIPERLASLYTAVEESRYIFSLPEGWNEANAKQIPPSIWICATHFLVQYALYLYNHFELILETPEINPVPNGTIDISWRTKNGRMLINIRQENNEILAYYYGDLYHDRFPVKGCVLANNITAHLVQWMKDYLAE